MLKHKYRRIRKLRRRFVRALHIFNEIRAGSPNNFQTATDFSSSILIHSEKRGLSLLSLKQRTKMMLMSGDKLRKLIRDHSSHLSRTSDESPWRRNSSFESYDAANIITSNHDIGDLFSSPSGRESDRTMLKLKR
jgi:hypothetical protein